MGVIDKIIQQEGYANSKFEVARIVIKRVKEEINKLEIEAIPAAIANTENTLKLFVATEKDVKFIIEYLEDFPFYFPKSNWIVDKKKKAIAIVNEKYKTLVTKISFINVTMLLEELVSLTYSSEMPLIFARRFTAVVDEHKKDVIIIGLIQLGVSTEALKRHAEPNIKQIVSNLTEVDLYNLSVGLIKEMGHAVTELDKSLDSNIKFFRKNLKEHNTITILVNALKSLGRLEDNSFGGVKKVTDAYNILSEFKLSLSNILQTKQNLVKQKKNKLQLMADLSTKLNSQIDIQKLNALLDKETNLRTAIAELKEAIFSRGNPKSRFNFIKENIKQHNPQAIINVLGISNNSTVDDCVDAITELSIKNDVTPALNKAEYELEQIMHNIASERELYIVKSVESKEKDRDYLEQNRQLKQIELNIVNIQSKINNELLRIFTYWKTIGIQIIPKTENKIKNGR